MHSSANLPGNLDAKLESRCEGLICRRIKDLKVSIIFANEFAVNVWIQLVSPKSATARQSGRASCFPAMSRVDSLARKKEDSQNLV
jgi:hypothetical protein